ncbi:hypothetical protein OESDEN_20107 [Oesophagostomum dentatum]|uniref:Uncharacterized protein n=1 Tax=Oesophagostomum dentatum TaxID=61180 RepID=A0A0B1SAJ1_OESDE|nr:hypothetical protein OESDEN_20107 [Oesophagostomum dentatum]
MVISLAEGEALAYLTATIRQFDVVGNVHVPLIQSPGSAVAMDFHFENETLVWFDIALQKILMCKIGNDSAQHHLAVREKVKMISGIYTNNSREAEYQKEDKKREHKLIQ